MGPLISATELRERLGEFRVLDARLSGDEYRVAHVTGAVRADLESDLSRPTGEAREGGRHPLPSLARWSRTLAGWGITPETRVAVYDDRGGALAAARAWWMLRASGHEEVAVVDGGWAAIRAAGIPTDGGEASVERAVVRTLDRWARPTVAMAGVEELRSDPRRRLIDVRARERFRGEREPLDPVAGHIPGAVNFPFVENLGPDGRFRSRQELRAAYRAILGDVQPEGVVFQCGSGVTACHGLLAFEHAGLPGAALYVGSWSEWCTRHLE